MADVTSILSASYKLAGLSVPSKTKYVAVDPSLFQGNWTGIYPDKKTFSIAVSALALANQSQQSVLQLLR